MCGFQRVEQGREGDGGALARDSAEAITVVYTHTPGMGVTVVYYFRDPQVLD
ncbi:hypothetical protein [Streptomyces sp. GESEQ-4]|uniref:hypothetical protein n=1 Tax=Streptomyces sp. GESEQ-4 TaxID=2812655 RepID=UPI001B332256|nr:hypothetical protein [Streptomyces sp. GESEQ-4]